MTLRENQFINIDEIVEVYSLKEMNGIDWECKDGTNWVRVDVVGDIVYPHKGWTINSHMKERFGDGEYYQFKRIQDNRSYTHMSSDGFFYHESWFKCRQSILKFEEEDFLI